MNHSYTQIQETFQRGKVLINYITAGYPTIETTVSTLLELQALGTDIIEIGVPFTDPVADGPTIQMANNVALKNGVTLPIIFKLIAEARQQGVTVPIILMGYYNVFYQYGMERLAIQSQKIGVNGFIIVDLPPEIDPDYYRLCQKYDRCLVPLVSLLTPIETMEKLVKFATGFIYCISVTGITGTRNNIDPRLTLLLEKLRKITRIPLAVGFGISNSEQAGNIWNMADGIIMGSSVIKNIQELKPFLTPFKLVKDTLEVNQLIDYDGSGVELGGGIGGDSHLITTNNCYLPEILRHAHLDLSKQFRSIISDVEFQQEYQALLKNYVGRPSPLYFAKNLTEAIGGAKIWLKREDLNYTGSHKINNAIGQALLAKKMGKTCIIAETGAGQHGIATATACCLLDLGCKIYMGAKDVIRQQKNVERIKLLGAELISVESGSKTLRAAINMALQDWISQLDTTHYLIGSAIGAEPYPEIVTTFQSVIGREARQQFQEATSKLPDYVLACVGGGSNAIGIFHDFINDMDVSLVGVEAGGDGNNNAASITNGSLGVLHGTKTFLLQDQHGQIEATHSISAGLDYPGIGPHHAELFTTKRASYVTITDREAVDAFKLLMKKEGLIAALESSHAVAYAIKLAKTLDREKNILVNLSGRGDKDIDTINKL